MGAKGPLANALTNLGHVAFEEGDSARAADLYEESLALARELSDRRAVAAATRDLGRTLHAMGDQRAAARLLEESLALGRESGDKRATAVTLTSLANLARDQGDYGRATALLTESLGLLRALEDRPAVAECLEAVAAITCAWATRQPLGASTGRELLTTAGLTGAYDRAVRLFGAATALRWTIGVSLSTTQRAAYEPFIASAAQALGEQTFSAARVAGAALTVQQALAYALDSLAAV